MPFYEYSGSNFNCDTCSSVFCVSQSIMDDPIIVCPSCGGHVIKLVSVISGHIVKNREANQFADIQMAKYWRDKNGVRHPVTSADGTSKSSTVSKQIVSEEVAKQRTKADRKMYKKQRSKDSYNKFIQNVSRQKHP